MSTPALRAIVLTVSTIAAAFATTAVAQPASRTTAQAPAAVAARPPKRADFDGIWSGEQGVLWDPAARGGKPETPPFTPEYAGLYQKALTAAASGKPFIDPPTICLPAGTPRLLASPFPIEIVLKPKEAYLLFEYSSQVRRVYLDAATAPQRIGLPTYNGYSTGRWDGEDLLVDTVDLLDSTVLDTTHLGHSDQLKVHERYHLVSPTKMEVHITLDDPKAYVGPWTVVRTYVKKPGEQILEYICEENNRNPVAADGTTGFVGPNK